MILPNLELDSVVTDRVGCFFFRVTFGGRNRFRFGERLGLKVRVRVRVEPDLLDLFGDVGDGKGFCFGAFECEPDGDEEEEEHDGGANDDAENHPETEAED